LGDPRYLPTFPPYPILSPKTPKRENANSPACAPLAAAASQPGTTSAVAFDRPNGGFYCQISGFTMNMCCFTMQNGKTSQPKNLCFTQQQCDFIKLNW